MEKLNRIKAVLADKDIQQKDFAEQLGRSVNTIARICNNKSQPTLEDLYRIANLLDVDVCELLISNKKPKT